MWLLLSWCLAAEPTQIAAMPDVSVSDRLAQLIAASSLSEAQLAALAAEEPAVVYQLRDQRSIAALAFILAMSPTDIRTVRDGRAVVRAPGSWSAREQAAVEALADQLDVKLSQVEAVHIRTHQAAVLKVELVGKKGGVVDLAWPPSWNASAIAATIGVAVVDSTLARQKVPVSGAASSGGVPVVDPGFEAPSAPAWQQSVKGDGKVIWDEARHAAGRRSLRLEASAGGTVTVKQRIVPPGTTLVPVSVLAAADNLEGEFRFGFSWGDTEDEEATVMLDPGQTAWTTLRLTATLPEEPPELYLLLRLSGAGAVNVDDLRIDLGSPTGVAEWARFDRGHLKVWADPMRVSGAAEAAATVDRAVKNATARLGVTATGTVRLFLYQNAADRAALGSPSSNPAAGYCWQTVDDAWPGACALSVFLHRAWGPPKNPLIADALPKALSGSGADLDALARKSLPGTPDDWPGRYPAVGSEVAPSFVAWFLEKWGPAALRAAWGGPASSISAGGYDLNGLLAVWRAHLGF